MRTPYNTDIFSANYCSWFFVDDRLPPPAFNFSAPYIKYSFEISPVSTKPQGKKTHRKDFTSTTKQPILSKHSVSVAPFKPFAIDVWEVKKGEQSGPLCLRETSGWTRMERRLFE